MTVLPQWRVWQLHDEQQATTDPPTAHPTRPPTLLVLQLDGHRVGRLVGHAKLAQAEDGGEVGAKQARAQHSGLVRVQVPAGGLGEGTRQQLSLWGR